MMSNARKIISLLLTVLMVFGSVATLLPTTVMAAEGETATVAEGELSVTFLGESGNTIAVIPFEGTTTIEELLKGNSADVAKVNKAIKQTDVKVFLGWTLEDGTTPVNATDEITESKTVKASFSKYKVYTAEDLAIEKTAGRLVNNRMLISDTTTTYDVEGKSRTFLHITPDESSTYYKRAHLFTWTLEATLSGYSVMAMNHITNARHKDLSKSSYIYCDVKTNSATPVYYTNPDTTIIADETTGYATGTEEILATYPVFDGITRFRISPWGAAQFGTITSASTTGIYPADYTQTYLDIEYIAFFEKEGAAEYFDYSKYGVVTESFDVTFIDENNQPITTLLSDAAVTVNDLIAKADSDNKAKIDAAIAQTPTRVFAGWAREDGEIVSSGENLTESMTLKATFSSYEIYTWSELLAEREAQRLAIASAKEVDLVNAFKIQPEGGSVAINWKNSFDLSLDAYEAFVVKYQTNASIYDNRNESFARIYDQDGKELGNNGYTNANGGTTRYIIHTTSSTNVNAAGTGVDDITAVFPLYYVKSGEIVYNDAVTNNVTGISGFRFAPFRGSSAKYPTVDGTADGTPDYTKAWFDIQYFALFEKEEAAEYFNYNTYLEQKDTAYFKNTDGAIVDEWTKSAIDGKITLPNHYNDNVDFLGWKIEGARDNAYYVAGAEIAISRPTVFVPFMETQVNLTVTDIKGAKTVEAIAGLDMPLKGYALQYVDEDTGELMVISGFEAGGTEYPVDDGYTVKQEETEIKVLYAPAYILSATDGTLEVGASRDAATVNAPVDIEEGEVYFKRITGIAGAVTKDVSQARFDLTEEGENTNKNANKITYAETPYVSYYYRTNIDLTDLGDASNTLKAAYSVNMFSHNDGYTGTAKFGQIIENVEPHDDWQNLVHKPETFGKMTANAVFPGYLDSIFISPWSNAANITITGEEYADIQYVGFFPNETAAKLFDHKSYIEDCEVEVTVEIDGEEYHKGIYTPGKTIELPDVPGVAGYLYNGKVLTTVRVPADNDNDGKVTISVTSRNISEEGLAEYIQSRGDLNNLKKAGEDGTITVVYIGGSATAGTGASNKAFSWASLTTKYLETKFTTVKAHNVALGGHGSRSAAYRLQKDVIDLKPDIVFIETSMNDYYNKELVDDVYNGKYYEYVIRTIREELSNTEIVTAYTINNALVKQNGKLRVGKHPTAASQDVIAAHYDVSSIDIGKYAFEAIFGAEGTYSSEEWAKYYQDSVHPLDAGYALYAKAIREYLEAALGGECPDEVPDEEVPELLNNEVFGFRPSVIDLSDEEAVEYTGMTLEGYDRTPTFTHRLKINKAAPDSEDNIGSGSVSFKFEGTELCIYMSVPGGKSLTTETGGELDSAPGLVKVWIDGQLYINPNYDSNNDKHAAQYEFTPDSGGPYLYGKNLENKEHEVVITLDGVDNTECIIYGILVGGELPKYTIDLTATEGGKVEYKGKVDTKHPAITAYEGQVLTFTAIPDVDEGGVATHYLRGWHDITNGQIVELGAETEYKYPVTKDAHINANFVPNALRPNVRFVAFTGRGANGYFKVNGAGEHIYFDEYVSLGDNVTLEAFANNGYVLAGWIRITQSSDVEVLVGTGATITVPAAGANVFYQPLFYASDDVVNLYVDNATNEIVSKEDKPEGYEENNRVTNGNINVIYCTKTDVVVNVFTVRGLNADGSYTDLVTEEAPVYAETFSINTGRNDTKWVISINEGEPVDVSYEKYFKFSYMFPAGTTIVISEVLKEDTDPDCVIRTLHSWKDTDKTSFTGAFDLVGEDFELVSHGILMSQSKEDLEAASAVDGEIMVDESVIVGHVRDNSDTATALYTVSKKHNTDPEDANKWYGKAFLVYSYKDGENTIVKCVFGETIPTV